jgi:hypothetical protein
MDKRREHIAQVKGETHDLDTRTPKYTGDDHSPNLHGVKEEVIGEFEYRLVGEKGRYRYTNWRLNHSNFKSVDLDKFDLIEGRKEKLPIKRSITINREGRTLRSGGQARPSDTFKQFFKLRSSVHKWVTPKLLTLILDELNERYQETMF